MTYIEELKQQGLSDLAIKNFLFTQCPRTVKKKADCPKQNQKISCYQCWGREIDEPIETLGSCEAVI